MTGDNAVRDRNAHFDSIARVVSGALRADIARAGTRTSAEVSKLVAELSRLSPRSETLWNDSDMVAHGAGVKRVGHADVRLLAMQFTSFAVEGRL